MFTLTQCHIKGENPLSPNAFQYLYPVILAHISSFNDGAYKSGEGEHRVAHEEVNWDSIAISVLLSMDSAGFPVALSWPQCLKFFSV